MIPRLYLENETNFNHNGIGALTESLSAVVIEEANGIFDLEVTYPIHGKWFSEIQKMRIITALPNTGDEEHRFRINEIVKSTNPNVVIIKASTKTNDISGSIIKEYKASKIPANTIMSGMKSKLFPPLNYDFLTDISTSISVDWFMRNPLNAVLGQEGSLVDALGGGELKRNNTNLYLYRRRGNENVARVAPSKNLRGLTVTESTKGLITRIQPYVIVTDYDDSSGEQTETVILGDVVDSPLVNNYPVQVVVPVDFGEYEITNKTDLDAKAKTYFTSMNPDCDKPNVELDLDLIQISDSSEYEKFRKFEAIKLFDTVSVYVPRYGVDSIVKINRVEFDVLREKVISIKAGQPRSSYSQSLEKTYNNKINDALVVINNKINTVQISADGKNQVFRGPNEPDISVSNEGDLWFKVLGNGEVEMYTFDGAYWQPNIPAGMSEEISKKIEEFETSIEQQGKDIDESIIKANQAVEDAGFSKTLAEDAKALGVTASTLADEAKTNANKAMTDAQEAIRQAGITGGVAADASAEATEARRLAGLAEDNAQSALTKANTAVTDASTALTNATKAFNKSVKSSAVAYTTSTNGSTPPTTGWGTAIPSPSPDVYIWTRTTIMLNDNTPVVSYSVGKIGAKGDQGLKGDTGATGGQGVQGIPGVNAPTIKSVVQQYYLSTSKTAQTGGSWLSTVPVWSSGKYYWVRVVTTYSNDTTTQSTPVLDNALNDSLVTALEAKTANQTLSTTVTQHATLIESKANSSTVDSLTGRVSTAEGSISTIAGEVALKASKSDVNTLTGRVTTAEGTITAQAGQIALKANTTDVNTLTGRVTTAEGNITTQAGLIALKANQSVVDTLTGRVSTTEAKITATDGKVTTLTTKTEGNTTSIGQLQTGYDGLRSTVTNVDWMARTNGALQLTPDPTFLTSANGIIAYNNSGNANVTVKRVQLAEGQPTGSPYILEIATTGRPTSPGLGGIVYIQGSRANAIFMVKFTAKLPTEYTLFHANNPIGNGSKVSWVTSREGTGTWTEYAYVVECGSSGSFSSFGHLYVSTGVAPVTWYIAKYELFDISKSQQQAFSDLQQDINGFKTTVQNTYADKTTVSQLAGQVELRATKTDVNALAGRVTTAEGSITTQAGQIDLKANTTTVNALTGRVSTAEGKITANTTAINLRATKTEVNTAIDGIQVGGRNLLRNSDFKNGLSYWGSHSGTSLSINSAGNMEVYYGGSSDNNSGMVYSVGLPTSDYVITAKIKRSTEAITTKFQIGRLNNYEPTLPPVNTWGVITAYLKNTGGLFYIYRNNPGAVGTLEVEWIKLEKGNKATDWTPAPEDVDAAISTVQSNLTVEAGKITALNTKTNGHTTQIGQLQTSYTGLSSTVTALETGKVGTAAFSALEQNLNGFKTTVANTYADKTTVTQLAGQWTATVAKVDGHTGQISNLGDQINLRLTKEQVDASILSDKTIKDTRNDNQTPLWYWQNHPRVITKELKLNAVIGIVDAGEFATLESDMLWSDYKAGAITQTAKTNSGVYQRRSSSNTTWGTWSKVADTSNILSQINLSTEGVLIAGKNIWLDGNTKINDAVIKTAHIADLAVSGAKIANASISSAKIISLDASKITAGTLNAGLVTVSTSNGNKQVSIDSDGLSALDSNRKLRLSIGVRDLGGVGQSDPSNIVFYSGNGNNSMYLGTNTADTFVIAPAGGKMQSLFSMPEGLTISSRQLRITDPLDTGQYIEMRRTNGAPYEMLIYPSKPGTGSIGNSHNGLWWSKIWVNMVNARNLNIGYGAGSPQEGDLSVGSDGGTPSAGSTTAYVRSQAIYNRIYGSLPSVGVTEYGTLGRIVSARKYKENITKANQVMLNAKRILDIYPSEWRIKGKIGKCEYGFIADDFHELGLTEVVQYGADGQVEGLAYDRISMYHNVILQDHERQLSTVTQQLTTVATERLQHTLLLESKLLSLEKTVGQLQQEIEQLK